jgi:Na+/melibiose symporter-like transporter
VGGDLRRRSSSGGSAAISPSGGIRTFVVAASFPLISFLMALVFVRETPSRADREAFRNTMIAIRKALREREIWIVAGFIFFFAFSPSFGPALLYYQTDMLKFSQQFIGHLTALGSAAAVVGALIYAPLSRRYLSGGSSISASASAWPAHSATCLS